MLNDIDTAVDQPRPKGFARFESAREHGHGFYVCAVEDADVWGLLIRDRDGKDVTFPNEDGDQVRWLFTNTSVPGKGGLREVDFYLRVNGFVRATGWVWHPNHSWWSWIEDADAAQTPDREGEAA